MSHFPDLILFNGTLHPRGPATSCATGAAISGKDIRAVGHDSDIPAMAGPRTRKNNPGEEIVGTRGMLILLNGQVAHG